MSWTSLPSRSIRLGVSKLCLPNLTHSRSALAHSFLATSPKVAGMSSDAHLLEAGGVAGLGVGGHRAEGDVVGPPLVLGRRVDVLDVWTSRRPLGEPARPVVDQLDRAAEPAVAELEVVVPDDVWMLVSGST